MTYTTSTEDNLKIEGIEKLVIVNYFASINLEEFERTATLFAEDGELLAPFEKPIIGRNAIASYLKQEAKGMQLIPEKGAYDIPLENTEQIEIIGKVKTALFTVNVSWFFKLNSEQKITRVKIKLLASPKELLSLKKFRK